MTLYTQPNLTSGIDQAIVSTAQNVPAFPIMLLLFVFSVIFIGGAANQKRRVGTADYPFWAVLGGVSCTVLSLLFTLKSGIISGWTLGVVLAFTIMFGVWFFLSSVKGEQ